MATIVYCSKGNHHYDGRLGNRIIFKNLDRSKCDFEVVSWKKGIVTVRSAGHYYLSSQWAQTIAGCFEENSNFAMVLRKYYYDSRKKNVKGIQFEYMGAMILITKRSAKTAIILRKMEDRKTSVEKKIFEYNQKDREERFKQHIMELKKEYRQNVIKEKIQEISSSTDIEFKDEQARETWEEFVKLNSNDDTFCYTISRANCFAKYVQYLIKTHSKSLHYFAEKLMELTCLNSGYYATVVIEMLCICWAHGDELFNFCKQHEEYRIANEVGM